MFSISEELSNFQPINLENVEEKIGVIPDDMKNAMELYNKALDEIGNRNEDIAIIALKKAVSLYPAFYEAMNLIGICYMSIGDEDNARAMFNKVIQMDDNSLRASSYLKRMDGTPLDDESILQSKPSKRQHLFSGFSPWAKVGFSPEANQPYYLKYIAGFILGIIVSLIILLAIPGDKPLVVDLSNLFGVPASKLAKIEELQGEILNLNDHLSEAQGALQTAKDTERQLQDELDQYIVWSDNLRSLEKLYYEGKYKEVVVEIEKNFAGLNIPSGIREKIIALNDQAKPKSIRMFYDSAKSIYGSNSTAKDLKVYEESASEYRMAMSIIEEVEEKPSYSVEVYYYGAKAIALSQSPSKDQAEAEAITCFEKVISDWPNSVYANYSRARINEIEEGKTIRH